MFLEHTALDAHARVKWFTTPRKWLKVAESYLGKLSGNCEMFIQWS